MTSDPLRRRRVAARLAAAPLLAALLVTPPSGPAPAATYYVEAGAASGLEDGCTRPFRTITAAIAGAQSRNSQLLAADPDLDRDLLVDEIRVRPGVYEENVTLPSGICLVAMEAAEPLPSDPNLCPVVDTDDCTVTDLSRRPALDPDGEPVVDPAVRPVLRGTGSGPVVFILSPGLSTVLDGFVITGGAGTQGGGVFVAGGRPKVANNVIAGNTVREGVAGGLGGGVLVHGEATVEANVIAGNTAAGGSGGGIHVASGSPTISRNVIRGNRALASSDAYFGYGGGIAVSGAVTFPIIRSNVIVGNRAEAGGGGIDVYRSSPFIVNNVVSGNAASGAGRLRGTGGGINVVGSKGSEETTSPALVNNVVAANVGAGGGGGIHVFRARPVTAGNDLHANAPDESGGARPSLGLDGNFSLDPALDPNHAPAPGSPLVEAGSLGVLLLGPDLDGDPNTEGDRVFRRRVLLPPGDFDGIPQPLDSTGSGRALPEVGAFERAFSPDPDDLDGDGIPIDGDGDPNTSAPCAFDPNGGYSGCDDNCPYAHDPDQADLDGDRVGDACDNCPEVRNGFCVEDDPDTHFLCDVDGDGTAEPFEIAHGAQADIDTDLVGDLCDGDRDNDGILEDDPRGALPCRGRGRVDCDDNCPDVTNATQRDRDHDGAGDACDTCVKVRNGFCALDPAFCSTDPDLAGLGDQLDTDGDGFGDACDNCPAVPNGACNFLTPEVCDIDGDGETTSAEIALGNQADLDDDREGDACEDDRDGDGIVDDADGDPNTPEPCAAGATTGCDDDCPTRRNPLQEDADGDGVGDRCDNCDEVRNGACDPNVAATHFRCDIDGDGAADAYEQSVGVQADFDRDRRGDACDPDDDNDGVEDDGDGSGVVGDSGCDPDPNGVFTACDDNCRTAVNSNQANRDHDLPGDACDDDRDGDGVPQDADPNVAWPFPCAGGSAAACDDNCPNAANGDCAADPLFCDADGDGAAGPDEILTGDQADADGDGIGDACDNCPFTANKVQADADGDAGVEADPNSPAADPNFIGGDVCDADADGDAVPEDADGDPNTLLPCVPDPNGVFAACDDNCPRPSNRSQADADGDGIGDACDNCVDVRNGDCAVDPLFCDADGGGTAEPEEVLEGFQADADGDRVGDACDPDADGDSVEEDGDAGGTEGGRPCDGPGSRRCDDNCPGLPNPSQVDRDGDGLGDLCDLDADGDGVPEDGDGDPATSSPCPPGQFAGCDDNCPRAANGDCAADPLLCDADGDGAAGPDEILTGNQADADGDGAGDACDNCPADGAAGPADQDGDGIGDACDNCPAVFNPGQADADADTCGDACEGLPMGFALRKRAGSEGVLRPGSAVRLEVVLRNRTGSGERFEVEASLRDPGGSRVGRLRAFTVDAPAGRESRSRFRLRVPDGAPPGTWTALVEAVRVTQPVPPDPNPACAPPGTYDRLAGGVAVTVK